MGDTKREIKADCFLPQAEDEGQRYGRTRFPLLSPSDAPHQSNTYPQTLFPTYVPASFSTVEI